MGLTRYLKCCVNGYALSKRSLAEPPLLRRCLQALRSCCRLHRQTAPRGRLMPQWPQRLGCPRLHHGDSRCLTECEWLRPVGTVGTTSRPGTDVCRVGRGLGDWWRWLLEACTRCTPALPQHTTRYPNTQGLLGRRHQLCRRVLPSRHTPYPWSPSSHLAAPPTPVRCCCALHMRRPWHASQAIAPPRRQASGNPARK